MPKRFQKRVENFVCENCGKTITGTGFTNHCPNCLWSKHVDINPGDRQSDCGGLMIPISLLLKHGKKFLIHRCLKCGHQKLNMVQPDDKEELVIKISSQPLKL